jgi:hypothetical protein
LAVITERMSMAAPDRWRKAHLAATAVVAK